MFRFLLLYLCVVAGIIALLPDWELPGECRGSVANACCFLRSTEVESPTGFDVGDVIERVSGATSQCVFTPRSPHDAKKTIFTWFLEEHIDRRVEGRRISAESVLAEGIPGARVIDAIDAKAYWIPNPKNGGELYVAFRSKRGIAHAFKLVAPPANGFPEWGAEREMARWVLRRFSWTIERNPAIEDTL